MISPVHVKTQPADCSQSQQQENSIGMIDFNFPAMVTETIYLLIAGAHTVTSFVIVITYTRSYRIINLGNAAEILGAGVDF